MSKITIAASIMGLLASTSGMAAVVYTNTVKVTPADNNAVYCQVVNIGNGPESVRAQLISFDGTVLAENTITVNPGVTDWPVSYGAGGGPYLTRCKFTLNKAKVRSAIAVFKNNGEGAIELLLEAR